MNAYAEMSREDLLKALEMFAKNWLAHDGAWFLAAEERFRLYTAMELDALAWERFAASEAKRIMSTFGIAAGGGLEALARALSLRMYALVNDVEAYPQFLPWCSGAAITQREGSRTVATLQINYRGIREQFTTENETEPGRSIEMRFVAGPFRHLRGHWQFTPLDQDACKVEFRLEYEISNRLLKHLMESVFHQIANTFVDLFVQRAEQLYPAR